MKDLRAVKSAGTKVHKGMRSAERGIKATAKADRLTKLKAAKRARQLQKRRIKKDKANQKVQLMNSFMKAKRRSQEGSKKKLALAKSEKTRKLSRKLHNERRAKTKRQAKFEKMAKWALVKAKKKKTKAKKRERRAKTLAKRSARARVSAKKNAKYYKLKGERYAKNRAKWRAMRSLIKERDGKRKRRVIGFKAAKAKAKVAKRAWVAAGKKCKKMKKKKVGIKKAYSKLKKNMKIWSKKNSWLSKRKMAGKLKKKNKEEESLMLGDDDPDLLKLDDLKSLGNQVEEEPNWMKMSVAEYIQEESGIDVNGLLKM